MKREIPDWFAIIPLLLFAAGIAILSVNRGELVKNSEFNTFRHIGLFSADYSLVDTVNSVSNTSFNHVPLYYMTLNVWSKLVGTSIEMLRTLSVYFGLLGIAFGYQLANRLISGRVAVFIVFMMATSAFFNYFMREMRMYSLMPMLIVGLYAAYWQIISSTKSIKRITWIALYGFSTAIIYTHQIGIFALVAIGVYHLLFAKKNTRWFKIVGIMILAGLTYSLWLPNFFLGANRIITDVERDKLLTGELVITLLKIYSNYFVVFGFVWLIGLVSVIRKPSKPFLFSITIMIVPILGIFAVNILFNLITVGALRYTIILLPSFALLSGYGMYKLVEWHSGWLVLLPIYAIAGVWFSQTDEFRDYTIQWARPNQYPPVYLITDYVRNNQYMPNPEPLFTITDIEAPRSFVRYYSLTTDNRYLHINPDDVLTEISDVLTETLVDLIDFKNEPAFWLGYRPEFDLASNTIYQTILTEYHESCGVREFNDNMIIEYYLVKGVPCEIIDAPFKVQYHADEIVLTHFYPIIDHDTLNLYSIWERASTNSAFPYSISFQIFNTDEEKVAQQDYIAPFEPIDVKELNISHLEAGIYTLTLTLYDPETGFINQGTPQYSGDLMNNVALSEFTIK